MTLEQAWLEKKFEVVWTEDGSPSLKSASGYEVMHHRGGAFSETQLIYGNVVREVMDKGGESFLSVGLGLGYNEFVVADEALLRNKQGVFLRSFETEPELKANLLEFVLAGGVPQNPAQEIYRIILERFKMGSEVPAYLAHAYKAGMWILDGALDGKTQFPKPAQGILFDAFSSRTSPELWTEDFLLHFFAAATDEYCLVSTYACTGALKRALKQREFEIVLREGFHGKRNSTLGRRESPAKNQTAICGAAK
jgi:hypothetical protein